MKPAAPAMAMPRDFAAKIATKAPADTEAARTVAVLSGARGFSPAIQNAVVVSKTQYFPLALERGKSLSLVQIIANLQVRPVQISQMFSSVEMWQC